MMTTSHNPIDISVIIPIYQVECYIEQCLQSLFTQSKTQGVEFILIDDCCRDESCTLAERIIAEYPQLDIKLIHHQTNKGVQFARQTGLDTASGDYILQIDADDSFEPDMLKDLYNCATATQADVVICDFYLSYTNRELLRKHYVPSRGFDCFVELAKSHMSVYLWNKLIKRSLITQASLDFPEDIRLWEDFTFNSKVFLLADKVAYVPKPFIHYKKRTQSISSYLSEQSKHDMIRAVEEVERFITQNKLEKCCKDALNTCKLHVHYCLLTKSDKATRRQYIQLYPNLVPYLDSSLTTSKKLAKHIYKDAIKGRFFILDIKFHTNRLLTFLFHSKKKRFSP